MELIKIGRKINSHQSFLASNRGPPRTSHPPTSARLILKVQLRVVITPLTSDVSLWCWTLLELIVGDCYLNEKALQKAIESIYFYVYNCTVCSFIFFTYKSFYSSLDGSCFTLFNVENMVYLYLKYKKYYNHIYVASCVV